MDLEAAKAVAAHALIETEVTRFGNDHLDEELSQFALELLERLRRDSGLLLDKAGLIKRGSLSGLASQWLMV